MNFNGIKKDEDRAAVIEYLRVADPSPEARPAAKPAEPIMMEKDEAHE